MNAFASAAEILLHEEASCEVRASPGNVFDHIDRPERLSAHMARGSWRLGGASMSVETDAAGGRAVGSRIRLAGRMMGLSLSVECVVVHRDPPRLKVWNTAGTPRLLVIGAYRMSVRIEPRNGSSIVTIDIDYALPASRLWRSFGPTYARWCVRQMVRDLVHRFGPAR